MTVHKLYSLKLTLNRSALQLKMNFSTDLNFVDDGKVALVQNLVERMDLKELKNLYSKFGRKPAVDPLTMLEVLIFCYSEGMYSSRKIAKACNYDLRLLYLLDGQDPPSHSSINRYRQKLEPHVKEILSSNIRVLQEAGQIDLSSVYIDGTKIEAYANRYTFVWKKSILKNQDNLRKKILNHFQVDENMDLKFATELLHKEFKSTKKQARKIQFVYGSGHRKTQVQKNYELYQEWIERLNKYSLHLEIMQERNSYSKTDHDATFMRLKDDHMGNGQLKAAYNIQLASSGQYVAGIYGSHHPNDLQTLPLFLDNLYANYHEDMDKVVTDSGYESIENYLYLKKKGLRAFIKPSNYDIAQTRAYKKDISKRENMDYDEAGDFFTCANQKTLQRIKDRTRLRKSGYRETLKVYKCFECNHCPYQKQCQKYSKRENPQTKTLQFNPDFLLLRQESRSNIVSKEGIEERLNRSIQAEGMFSKMKEGLQYTRFRHRGLQSVLCDLHLLVLGMNLNQLHRNLLSNQTESIKYSVA